MSNAKLKQQWQTLKQGVSQHTLTQQATARWRAFNEREQRLLAVLAGVLGLALLYFVIWQPSVNAVAQAEQRLSGQQQQLRWVQQSLAKYQALSQAAESDTQQAEQADQSSTQRLNAAATAMELSIARMQPQQNGVLVTIDEADFSQVIDFIASLQRDYGLQVSVADMARLDAPGQVRVRQLLVMDAS